MVLVQFDIPEQAILLSDFERYHYVFNYWYLPVDEEDELLQQESNFFTQKPLPNNHYHQRIVDSWKKIFDLGISYPFDDIPINKRRIQGTLWEIKKDWVTNHYFFTGKDTTIITKQFD